MEEEAYFERAFRVIDKFAGFI